MHVSLLGGPLFGVLLLQQLLLPFEFLHDDRSTALTDIPAVQQFVQNEVRLVEVEYEIEFAHITEVLIENFHE